MVLTQQFLLVSILPLSFLGLAVYLWRARARHRAPFGRWAFTLLVAAIWASSILRLYGGVAFTPILQFNWYILGNYAFTFLALAVLYTTNGYLAVPRAHGRLAITISFLLWAGALALDPSIWPYQIPASTLAGQSITHFNIWAAVWVASWFLPLTAARLLTQRLKANVPGVLYLNQIQYWVFMLTLMFVGFALASVQEMNQPLWQEAGILVVLLATYIGTISIGNDRLPNLQLRVRQWLSRLSGTLIIFGLTWLALTATVRWVSSSPNEDGRNVILLLVAVLFAGLFTLLYRVVNEFTRRLFLPAVSRHEVDAANYANVIGNLPEPAELGQFFLRMVQSTLTTDDAWLFVAEDGPAGRLILRPLAGLHTTPQETADFQAHSPFTKQLRQNRLPLAQYDLTALSIFDAMPQSEKSIVVQWDRVLFMPLHAGDSLIGVLGLGPKLSGELYNRQDLNLLQLLATQIGPLLAQAQNLAILRQTNDYVFQQNQSLARNQQHLVELVGLYHQFFMLLSPDLRKPFVTLGRLSQRLQEEMPEANRKQQQLLNDLNKQLTSLKQSVDTLLTTSGRLESRHEFQFQVVKMGDLIETAVRNLRTMADARRVRVEFNHNSLPTAVVGDEQQLLEATQNLLHNAIKFNKIGGSVRLDFGQAGNELYLHIIDTGVGIPLERLPGIWDGLTRLNQNGATPAEGIGLSLTRFIIAAHGGRVEAQSKYGSGSVFSFYLPLAFEET